MSKASERILTEQSRLSTEIADYAIRVGQDKLSEKDGRRLLTAFVSNRMFDFGMFVLRNQTVRE